jgi:hypothetical protein
MYRLSASLLFLAGTLTLAQSPGSSQRVAGNSPAAALSTSESVVLYADRPDSSGCPVGFFASRQGTSQIMSASDAAEAGPAQGLHLVLNHLNAPAIQSVEVTVYGVSPRAVVLPANSHAGSLANATITKTFELERQAGSTSLSDADVWMHHVGSLSRVDLISITYANGSTWHASEGFKCRAVPSNVVLVGRR